jgi:hypothetical protein
LGIIFPYFSDKTAHFGQQGQEITTSESFRLQQAQDAKRHAHGLCREQKKYWKIPCHGYV